MALFFFSFFCLEANRFSSLCKNIASKIQINFFCLSSCSDCFQDVRASKFCLYREKKSKAKHSTAITTKFLFKFLLIRSNQIVIVSLSVIFSMRLCIFAIRMQWTSSFQLQPNTVEGKGNQTKRAFNYICSYLIRIAHISVLRDATLSDGNQITVWKMKFHPGVAYTVSNAHLNLYLSLSRCLSISSLCTGLRCGMMHKSKISMCKSPPILGKNK